MYAYFIDISQGTVETRLWRDGMCNNHFIANCLQSAPVKEFWKSINNNIGEDMDKSKVARFLAHPAHCSAVTLIVSYCKLNTTQSFFCKIYYFSRFKVQHFCFVQKWVALQNTAQLEPTLATRY